MMLHCLWYDRRLHIWSDALLDGVTTTEQLRSLLGELSADGLLASVAQPSQVPVQLPQRDGKWLGVDATGPAALAPTIIDTLSLRPADAIDLLSAMPTPSAGPCGDSFAFYHRLAGFVLSMVRSAQFFPDLAAGDTAPWARWRLALEQPALVGWLQQMADAMPPFCRSAADGAQPLSLVEQFVNAAADSIVRRAMVDDGGFILPVQDTLRSEQAAGREAPPELLWLEALLRDDDAVDLPPAAQGPLGEQVRHWASRIAESGYVAPARLRVRLEDPDDIDPPAEQRWLLHVLLESLDDSGPIPAQQLLAEHEAVPELLQRNRSARRQQLVDELRRVGEVFAPLRLAADGELALPLKLSTVEAHGFLRGQAQQLHNLGVAVELPDWVSDTRSLPMLELRLGDPDTDLDSLLAGPDPMGTSTADDGGPVGAPRRFHIDSLLHFDWRVAVGDLSLSIDEFRGLLAAQSPLVRHRGQWIQIDLDAASRALEFVAKKPAGQISFAEAIRTSLYATPAQTGLALGGLSSGNWLDRLLRQAPPEQMQAIEQPDSFRGSLRPYQLRGLQWLAFLQRLGLGACLADDMGLGKTIQLIALLLQERQHGRAVPPTLVFAPTSVVGNWAHELQRFSPDLRVALHHGPLRLSGEAFIRQAKEIDVVVSSYALAYRDAADLAAVHWGRLVLDEAQKIKNPSAAATLAIRAIPAIHRVALTGTPIENRLSELWSIMEVLNPGLLGSAGEFRERLAVPIERLHDQSRAEQLRRLIRPFVLRRTKDDPAIAGDLPPKMEMKVFCNLTPEQAALYQQVTDRMLSAIDSATGIRRRGLVLAALTRLKQICNHPAQFLRQPGPLDSRSGKSERLVEMLEEVLEEGDSALVFTQYREMAQLLHRLLLDRLRRDVLLLHGGTPTRKRQDMVTAFNGQPQKHPIMILSLRAGGLGLNLTAASHVFHFDRWWNPAVENQATDRAHRIGQSRVVQVHKLICVGTMEERIDKMLTEKLALAGTIIGTGDDWLTSLSTEQIRQYLALSPDAASAEGD